MSTYLHILDPLLSYIPSNLAGIAHDPPQVSVNSLTTWTTSAQENGGMPLLLRGGAGSNACNPTRQPERGYWGASSCTTFQKHSPAPEPASWSCSIEQGRPEARYVGCNSLIALLALQGAVPPKAHYKKLSKKSLRASLFSLWSSSRHLWSKEDVIETQIVSHRCAQSWVLCKRQAFVCQPPCSLSLRWRTQTCKSPGWPLQKGKVGIAKCKRIQALQGQESRAEGTEEFHHVLLCKSVPAPGQCWERMILDWRLPLVQFFWLIRWRTLKSNWNQSGPLAQ